MSCPLYAGNQTPSTLPATAHPGLWFDKFCDQWADDWRGLRRPTKGDPGGKHNWLGTLAANLRNEVGRSGPTTIGNAELLKEQVARIRSLMDARRGSFKELTSSSRVVAGMGIPIRSKTDFAGIPPQAYRSSQAPPSRVLRVHGPSWVLRAQP